MGKIKVIIIGIVILVLIVGLISYGIYWSIENRNKEVAKLREDCDFFVVTSYASPLDCYSPRFYNRMNDLHQTGTFCFKTSSNIIFLKCYWEDKTELAIERGK